MFGWSQKEKAEAAELEQLRKLKEQVDAKEAKEAKEAAALQQAIYEADEAKAAQNAKRDAATKKGESYFEIIDIEMDKDNLANGSFEFDWNDIFIKELMQQGFAGKTDEDIVDGWFRSVCKHVVLESYEQSESDIATGSRVTKKDLGDGKVEIS